MGKQFRRMPGDDAFLVGRYDVSSRRARIHADAATERRLVLWIVRVATAVETDAQERQPRADPFANRSSVLADTTGKHECIGAAKRDGHSGDVLRGFLAEILDRFRGRGT